MLADHQIIASCCPKYGNYTYEIIMSLLETDFSLWRDILPLDAQWQPASACKLTAVQTQWLCSLGSMTERLRASCRTLHVKVGHEGFVSRSQLAACEWLSLPSSSLSPPSLLQSALPQGKIPHNADDAATLWLRDVLLCCDGVPWIFARTLIPKQMLQQQWQHLPDIGAEPIGQTLFADPNLQRQALEIATLRLPQPLAQTLDLADDQPLLARRSRLVTAAQSLLVTEVFLPFAPVY
ncbi:chorismate--pyruvate lyase family protein [Plesiomonas sp.]|uniref:chorismate--pyruvate lyase family protein n=1 Tax=Plesiomonas sp. TaxID=2486279 RepID=UPI003F2B54B2